MGYPALERNKMKFRVGDIVRCQGHLAVIVAHKLYDAKRDGYMLEYLSKGILAPTGRGTTMVLPEDLTLASAVQKVQKDVENYCLDLPHFSSFPRHAIHTNQARGRSNTQSIGTTLILYSKHRGGAHAACRASTSNCG